MPASNSSAAVMLLTDPHEKFALRCFSFVVVETVGIFVVVVVVGNDGCECARDRSGDVWL